MRKIKIIINSQEITVPENSTILEAAAQLNINIPTLCYLPGQKRFTSCMLCVVHEISSDRLLPACSAPVAKGMRIETDNAKVFKARRDTLEMLLSEHIGNCRAPCQRTCPAQMNIPLMIRQIKAEHYNAALITVKKDIALPAVLGRICTAPCEKGCLRGIYDSPVSICHLKKFVADMDLAQTKPYSPECRKKSGKKVAIVGAGPTGLSAAYYLQQYGHNCFIFDQHPFPGGMLRYGVSKILLPESVLNKEIATILALGAVFYPERILGKDLEWKKLTKNFDAVVLAVGKIDPAVFQDSQLDLTSQGIKIDRKTFATSVPGFFAGGNSVSETRMAVRSVGHGKNIAYTVNHYLHNREVKSRPQRFESRTGKLKAEDIAEYTRNASQYDRLIPAGGIANAYTSAEAQQETARCFNCDCSKPDSCRLRFFADEYQAEQKPFLPVGKRHLSRVLQHEKIIYEPGKCIRCGLCVRITEKAGEKLGLTFISRGANVRVETPFNEPLDRGVVKTTQACIKACPTAALSWRDRSKE